MSTSFYENNANRTSNWLTVTQNLVDFLNYMVILQFWICLIGVLGSTFKSWSMQEL